MGDRTNVTLTVLASQAEETKTYFGEEAEENTSDPLLTEFTFEEVNYGNLDFLHKLREAGISYESAWGSGDEYSEGTEYCRFTETGEVMTKEVYDGDINPDLDLLLQFVDDHEKLRQVILSHKDEVTPPTWDNQEEYGKLYQMLKLVTPV